MRPDILILGQGLAGTLLGWELERAGIAFAIADQGHASAATMAAAGIINPITGRRLVKSWRVDEWLAPVRARYADISADLGASLWRDMRVRRLFGDERERRIFAQKRAAHELAPFAGADDEAGFWINGAARVDLQALLEASRLRWQQCGGLRATVVNSESAIAEFACVIDCTGAAGARSDRFSFVPWEYSKGEMLEIAAPDLAPDVIVNRGHWVCPSTSGRAWVGATHEPGAIDAVASTAARGALEASARQLLGREFRVIGQRAGVRVNLPDKRPAVGWHPTIPRLGLLNGLGAKGALWTPMLAAQWREHLVHGTPFESESDVRRFDRSIGETARAGAQGTM